VRIPRLSPLGVTCLHQARMGQGGQVTSATPAS